MATWSSALAAHLVPARVLEQRETGGRMGTGMAEVDGATGGGWPRGALSEVAGPRSSGKTTLLLMSLGNALAAGEAAALVDVGGGLDPRWAQTLGVHLSRLLWVRCDADQALPAADMVLGAGGFGLLAIDFGDQQARAPTGAWQRLKRTAAEQRTALLVGAPYRPPGALGKVALRMAPGMPRFAYGAGPALLLQLQAQAQIERTQNTNDIDVPRELNLHWQRKSVAG